MSNKTLFFSIMAFFAVLTAIGCWLLVLPLQTETYVPSAKVIAGKGALRPFLVDAEELEGVFGGMEISSLVFRYRSGAPNQSDWKKRIEAGAREAGWKLKGDADSELIFERLLQTQPTHRRKATSEECRLFFDRETRRVTGAWILVDNDRRPEAIAKGPGATWAKDTLWPEYLRAR